MKTNREQIYDFIKLHFSSGSDGVSTKYIADTLGMQRTNVSSLLNDLVADNLVQKTNGRPVLYYIEDGSGGGDDGCFVNLVGGNGSLARAVQLAKAAILYPQKSLNTLITGARGTGKSFLAMLMHRYAVESGVLLPDAFFVKFDCRDYVGDEQLAIAELFGDESRAGCIESARRGAVLIDYAETLSPRVRSMLGTRASAANGRSDADLHSDALVIIACDEKNHAACEELAEKLPIVINLPPLGARPLSERMEFISIRFNLEAARSKRTFVINAEVLRCLLLYDCELNLSGLIDDIRVACANAYVRERSSNQTSLNIYISDFEHRVRKGFVHYSKHRDEVERIIPADYSYSFNGSVMEMTGVYRAKAQDFSFYTMLDRLANDLAQRGMAEKDIGATVSAELESRFAAYRQGLESSVADKEQLSKLVDPRIIDEVDRFLGDASVALGETFPPSVMFGLCLHLNAVVNGRSAARLPAEKISEIVSRRAEYSISAGLAKEIERIFSINLSIDEVVLIAMFLCYKAPAPDLSTSPVVLFAFHGEGVARSVAQSVDSLVKCENVFYIEFALDTDAEKMYSELRQKVSAIHRGSGVMVLYDMDIIGKILDTVSLELDVPIRQLKIPLISLGIDCARRAAVGGNIDELWQSFLSGAADYSMALKKVIVALCSTGEGGAAEIKKYIEKYGGTNMEVIPLAMADRTVLRDSFAAIQKKWIIHCVVGTFDPKLFSLPFISVSELLSVPVGNVPQLLEFKRTEKQKIDFDEVYGYLAEQLEHVDIEKLKKTLPDAVKSIEDEVGGISLDTEIGLFMHIACAINRMLGREPMPQNLRKEMLSAKYPRDFAAIIRLLKPLEKKFGVIFSDDEVANMLTIIKRI